MGQELIHSNPILPSLSVSSVQSVVDSFLGSSRQKNHGWHQWHG